MARPNSKRDDNVVSLGNQPGVPPSHLEDEEASLWRHIVRAYKIDDAAALEVLSVALTARGRMRRCRLAIDQEGEVIQDRWNQPKAHPLLVAERGARDSFLKALRVLNFDLAGVR